MNDWRTRLKEADAARSQEMSAEDVQKIKCAVREAAREAAARGVLVWRLPFVLVAAVLVVAIVGATSWIQLTRHTNRHSLTSDQQDVPGAPSAAESSGAIDRQQLQFATPGGTRIIWVFDPNFEVKGTLP